MSEIKLKLFNGRRVKEEKIFEANGTFGAFNNARYYLKENGYSYGSTCVSRQTAECMPVAIRKGEYDLPQKWHNFSREGKAACDGVMISDDFREGSVKMILFEDKTIL